MIGESDILDFLDASDQFVVLIPILIYHIKTPNNSIVDDIFRKFSLIRLDQPSLHSTHMLIRIRDHVPGDHKLAALTLFAASLGLHTKDLTSKVYLTVNNQLKNQIRQATLRQKPPTNIIPRKLGAGIAVSSNFRELLHYSGLPIPAVSPTERLESAEISECLKFFMERRSKEKVA